jgi:gliding motility-associated-like protein
MQKNKYYFFSLFMLLSFLFQQTGLAQCTTPINSFPYNEDFELSDGNWASGGTLSDWTWGQPAKTVINAAAGGVKCWIIGGTSGTTYNGGEKSWLQSPCFNISSLSNPQVSFKVFWETEQRYDGAAFEFSTDGGITWGVVGSINSNSNCSGQNWFNFNPINFLGSPGWSGNIQSTSGSCQGGGGSGGWLTARHSLSAMTGATAIIFRFTFAAGITCNSFDGFAIDDFQIGEATPNMADFIYTCSANNTVDFTSNIVGCKTNVSWNFGDVASGSNNSSSLDNPSHTFSSPGNYIITLTVNFVSGPAVSTPKQVNVISLSAVVNNTINCKGDQTGAVSVTVNPPGVYNYNWDTSPPQTIPAISNLSAGTYTVTVTGTNTCSASLPVLLTEPGKLSIGTIISDAKCASYNGSIISTVNGGTTPYSYAWSNAATTASVTNLAAGTYSLLVTDAKACLASVNNLQVNAVNLQINVFLGNDTSICPGEKLLLSPGNFVSYKWQDNSTAPAYPVTTTGVYSVSVTDADGCSGSASIKVNVECLEIYFPSAFTPNGDGFNDGFGPLPASSLPSLKNYKFTVYGRWGEVIFTTTDPFKKWNGTYKGKALSTQVLTWIATYTQNNFLPVFQKGTVSIIR